MQTSSSAIGCLQIHVDEPSTASWRRDGACFTALDQMLPAATVHPRKRLRSPRGRFLCLLGGIPPKPPLLACGFLLLSPIVLGCDGVGVVALCVALARRRSPSRLARLPVLASLLRAGGLAGRPCPAPLVRRSAAFAAASPFRRRPKWAQWRVFPPAAQKSTFEKKLL